MNRRSSTGIIAEHATVWGKKSRFWQMLRPRAAIGPFYRASQCVKRTVEGIALASPGCLRGGRRDHGRAFRNGRLLHFEAEFPHQRAPFGLLAVDLGGVVVGRALDRVGPFPAQPLLHVFGSERALELAVEPVDDGARRAG